MSKAIPQVQKFMTYVPKSIGFDRPLSHAIELMREMHVRHLPVLKAGQLVGILTERDVNLVMGYEDANPEKMTVEDAYTPDPYFTTPSAPINEVAARMAEKKFGCAIVLDNHKLVGIFTEVDALKALAEVCETRLKH